MGVKRSNNMPGKRISASPAVALVSMPDADLAARANGGRAAQRLWLKASQLGIAVHPISAPIFLAHHVRHEGGGAFDPSERQEILDLFQALSEVFILGRREPLFMVRLSHAGAVTARSLRRPLKEVFHIASPQHA